MSDPQRSISRARIVMAAVVLIAAVALAVFGCLAPQITSAEVSDGQYTIVNLSSDIDFTSVQCFDLDGNTYDPNLTYVYNIGQKDSVYFNFFDFSFDDFGVESFDLIYYDFYVLVSTPSTFLTSSSSFAVLTGTILHVLPVAAPDGVNGSLYHVFGLGYNFYTLLAFQNIGNIDNDIMFSIYNFSFQRANFIDMVATFGSDVFDDYPSYSISDSSAVFDDYELISAFEGCGYLPTGSQFNFSLSGGYQDGYNDGLADGEDIGYDEGYDAGHQSGVMSGYEEGYHNGYSDASSQFNSGVSDQAQSYDPDRTFFGDFQPLSINDSFRYRFAQFYPGDPTIGLKIVDILHDNLSIDDGLYQFNLNQLIRINNYATFSFGFNTNADFTQFHDDATSLIGVPGWFIIGQFTLYLTDTSSDRVVQFLVLGSGPDDTFSEYDLVKFVVRFDDGLNDYYVTVAEFDSWSSFRFDTLQYVFQVCVPVNLFVDSDNNVISRYFDIKFPFSTYISTSIQSNEDSFNSSAVLASQCLYYLTFDQADLLITEADQAYDSGYSAGFESGKNSVDSSIFYDNGYDDGYSEGYDVGLSLGQSDISASITGFLPSILGAAGDFIVKVLDFEVFGVSMLTILGTFGAIFVLAMFVKMVM